MVFWTFPHSGSTPLWFWYNDPKNAFSKYSASLGFCSSCISWRDRRILGCHLTDTHLLCGSDSLNIYTRSLRMTQLVFQLDIPSVDEKSFLLLRFSIIYRPLSSKAHLSITVKSFLCIRPHWTILFRYECFFFAIANSWMTLEVQHYWACFL